MKNGISIIIPCYNTGKYLKDCLDSIINQKLESYEIILIDDCSSDNTVEIIDSYTCKYDNIISIKNKENRGQGYNRNIALKKAKYDLVSFVDSDDYLEENFYSELLKNMKDYHSDIALCDIYIRYDKSLSDEADIRAIECEGKVCKENILNTGHCASACNKIFKKELILKYPFPEDIMNEDVSTVLACIVQAKKISYTDKTYYNYIQRPKSTQNKSISFKRFDLFRALEVLKERIETNSKFSVYWDIIIYQQLIMFYLYIPPKEKDFFKRYKFLKKLSENARKYRVRQNHYFWNFLAAQGRKHKYYYKLFLKFNDSGFCFLANLMISFYSFYHFHFVKEVIPDIITMETLEKLAKKQGMKKTNKYKLSVGVPNYNYEEFLYQRIYSILYQTEKIDELILLDDCSKDNSRQLIDEMVDKLGKYINIKKVYNKQNSGTAFKQWEKSFKEATGDYLWIAEADDFCDKKFLKTIFSKINKHDNVVLAYCDTAFIDKKGKIILPSIKGEIDILSSGHWDQSYINNGLDEVRDYAYLNCTIANVSSVIFKNGDYRDYFKLAGEYRQAGDWLFYVNVMKNGNVLYSNKRYNYYRVHGNNVTTMTKKKLHLEEIKKVHKYVKENFEVSPDATKQINKRYKFLKRVWKIDD